MKILGLSLLKVVNHCSFSYLTLPWNIKNIAQVNTTCVIHIRVWLAGMTLFIQHVGHPNAVIKGMLVLTSNTLTTLQQSIRMF
jgi:hypothetical protein